MDTERVTLRLPKIYLQQIDLLLSTGDFMTRSEVIRHAISEYIENHSSRMIEKANKLREMQQIAATNITTEEYLKK